MLLIRIPPNKNKVKCEQNQVFRPLVRSSLKLSNPYPVIGSGTDSAVYHVAGEQKLLAERKKIGNIAPGQVAVTPAFTVIP